MSTGTRKHKNTRLQTDNHTHMRLSVFLILAARRYCDFPISPIIRQLAVETPSIQWGADRSHRKYRAHLAAASFFASSDCAHFFKLPGALWVYANGCGLALTERNTLRKGPAVVHLQRRAPPTSSRKGRNSLTLASKACRGSLCKQMPQAAAHKLGNQRGVARQTCSKNPPALGQ